VHRLELKVPPLLVAAALGAAMWAVDRQWFAPRDRTVTQCLLALAIAAAGLLVVCSAVAGFRRARTTVDPTTPAAASAIVTGGIYGRTRNPMYLGFLLVLLAWAVYLGNAYVAGFPVLFVLYMNRFQIAPEERALRARFGAPYDAYLHAVRRWL
jgi:protein-S-isoprenylcysteine O-methyltransferase Ste14